MSSLVIENPLSVDYVEPSRVIVPKMKTTLISWYTTKYGNSGANQQGYCGQDESALLYIHLPDGNEVDFNLNRTHPEDDFQQDKYGGNRGLTEMLAWITNLSHGHKKR